MTVTVRPTQRRVDRLEAALEDLRLVVASAAAAAASAAQAAAQAATAAQAAVASADAVRARLEAHAADTALHTGRIIR